ncbi:MAG: hypothetical protein N4A61_10775 [Pelagimonas sp.]|jgi:hemin uptake protein HemP|nr:hypothetical protein [Pelagimonas sp.]
MGSLVLTAASVITFAAFSGSEAQVPRDLMMAQAQPTISTQGVRAPQGEYMTTHQGCTYRKTQAPGYPARWILVVNPKNLNMASNPTNVKCRGML